ncbi:MAG: BrnA antitoxin family protein [Sphingomonas sp.]|nr:BrnA antitoxin family protein [Sphingomonas sp.]
MAKQQVTLRIDPNVIAKFREGGPGWQARKSEEIENTVEL